MIEIHLIQTTGGDLEIFASESLLYRRHPEKVGTIKDAHLHTFAKQASAILHNLLMHSEALQAPEETIAPQLCRLGKALFSLLAEAGNLPQTLFHNSGRPVVFLFTEELAHLPLEMLHDGNGFLCDFRPVVRVLRRKYLTPQISVPPNRSFLLPLIVRHPLEEKYQAEEIETIAMLAPKSNYPTERLYRPLAKTDFLSALASAACFHYSGHSESDCIPLETGEQVNTAEIANLNLAGTKMVFLNSCSGSSFTAETRPLVLGFLQAGTKEFVGYSHQVPHRVALWAGIFFWKNYLTDHNSIKTMYRLRRALVRQFGVGHPARLFLQHYMQLIPRTSGARAIFIKITVWLAIMTFALTADQIYKGGDVVIPVTETRQRAETLQQQHPATTRKHFSKTPDKPMQKKQAQHDSVLIQKYERLKQEFLASRHPFYSPQELTAIADSIDAQEISLEAKIIKLQAEFYR